MILPNINGVINANKDHNHEYILSEIYNVLSYLTGTESAVLKWFKVIRQTLLPLGDEGLNEFASRLLVVNDQLPTKADFLKFCFNLTEQTPVHQKLINLMFNHAYYEMAPVLDVVKAYNIFSAIDPKDLTDEQLTIVMNSKIGTQGLTKMQEYVVKTIYSNEIKKIAKAKSKQ